MGGMSGPDASTSGTTCTLCYHDMKEGKLTVAHVGDSRGVLWRGKDQNVVMATTDHKPDLPEEKKRIESMGGRVVFDGYYNHRVFSQKGMYPGLNMSRAIGDLVAHEEAGLTADPDIRTYKLDEAEWRM